MSSGSLAYSRKLIQRAGGIWNNLGLVLERQSTNEDSGVISIALKFHDIVPTQAELLVSEMSKAFRRANIFWKSEDGILICIEIPPM